MKSLNYIKGIGILFGIIILGLIGVILLGILQFRVALVYLLISIVFFVIAIFILPSYIGKKKEIKSESYSLKKVKKS